MAGFNAKIISMRNQFRAAICVLAASVLSLGSGMAQQTPSTTTKPATTTKPPTTTSKSKRASSSPTHQPLKVTSQKEKLTYAIAMNIGRTMKKDALDMAPAILTRALKDALAGSKPQMTEEEAKAVITTFRNEMIAKKQAEEKKISDANKQAGEQFLATNKTRQGVVTLPSGLQCKIIKQGAGPKPTTPTTVETNHGGTLIKGTEFECR